MIRVKNQRVINQLSRKSMGANRVRNTIAALAIALTTLLFTALFTIALTMGDFFQQQTFRQVGGDFHGGFKRISEVTMETLKKDPLIVRSGGRLMLGRPNDPPFNKANAEISYMDPVYAKGSFCSPTHGRLPAEGSDEIACDTQILDLLGVEPKIGAKLTLTYDMGGSISAPQKTTTTFTLSGWWEYDPAVGCSMAVVPLSYTRQMLAGYTGSDPDVGTWSLNVYLKSAAHIEEDLNAILANAGLQSTDKTQSNFVDIGVNWGYMEAQFSSKVDPTVIAGIVVMLVLIILTGYLIIYNIFMISVNGDIRFYGLLKTIGTTGRQIRGILLRQALLLSAMGIPVGLVLGYFAGCALSPAVLRSMQYDTIEIASAPNPLIFVGAAAFSLLTVLLSCRKPGRIAGRVSPIEAVRYTGNADDAKNKKTRRRTSGRLNMAQMALANLGRGRGKTVLVVLSLSLAVMLLELTCTLVGGFDMDKYLNKWVVSDYIVASAQYFKVTGNPAGENDSMEQAVQDITAQGGVTEGGRNYLDLLAQCFVSEDAYRKANADTWSYLEKSEEAIDQEVQAQPRLTDAPDSPLASNATVYGMDAYPLSELDVLEGSLDDLADPTKNAIAAVCDTDDYDKPLPDSLTAKVGDTITIRYVDELELYDTRTGKTVADDAPTDEYTDSHAVKWHDVQYTVAAIVTMRMAMSTRFFGSNQYVMGTDTLKRDSPDPVLLMYLFNTNDGARPAMNQFLENYTTNLSPMLDYQTKDDYVSQFAGMRSMFTLLGFALAGVIGLVGVLNYLNAILTSIMTRRREFAVLQSIGMTGRQLKTMLVCEGLLYALFTIVLSLGISVLVCPLFSKAISGFLWFFTYHITFVPFAVLAPVFVLLGAALPLIAYRFTARQTIVERLREAE